MSKTMKKDTKPEGVSRRSFLGRSAAGTAAGAVAAGLGTSLIALREAQAAELDGMTVSREIIKTGADVMCPSECGISVAVKDGVACKIYGNPHVPFNDGTLCAKGASGIQLTYSPDRNKVPLIRVGERGSGQFRTATWPEAIKYIADKLVAIKKQYGAESVVMDAGDVTDRDTYYRLFFAFGTPHAVEHGAICDTPRRHGPRLMLGGKRIEPDVMRPVYVRQPNGSLAKDMSYKNKLIVYCGWNPFVATRINYESRGTVGAKVENDCKVVVIDPSFSNTASKADAWLPIRPGTDGDLFAAVLRYILENDATNKFIDWTFLDYADGWTDFDTAFRSWWTKSDPINGLSYFSIPWAAQRTGLEAAQISWLAHLYGSTKPAALIWGMQAPGHQFNGYCASILGTTLNIITGNFDVPGGAIDTELTKSSKGGSATGKDLLNYIDPYAATRVDRKVTRTVNSTPVEGKIEELHMDAFGDWPAAWDEAVGDYPRRFLEGVTLKYGPFKGLHYPVKAYIQRTGNTIITGSATWKWIEALTAKDSNGNYKVELSVNIDSLFLESALYADVILPEAAYLERISLSDIYPSCPVIYNRDRIIAPLHECKSPYEIMQLLAKALVDAGDTDIKAEHFWSKYAKEEDFWDEALKPAPGIKNVGTPRPYPQYAEGYKLIGTPESLESGSGVTVDDTKKEVKGAPVTIDWLRTHNGVAVWPMAWYRHKGAVGSDGKISNTILKTGSGKFEFKFKAYDKYNKRIAGNDVPPGLQRIGFTQFPPTFYWFETIWNPYTNPAYQQYAASFPFQLICGRIHHSMSGTQGLPWLAETPAEGTWMPLNDAFEHNMLELVPGQTGSARMVEETVKLGPGKWAVGTVLMNAADARNLGIRTGDLVEVENPLGRKVRTRVWVSEGIRPGVLKMGFGTGARFSRGLGGTYKHREYTPNHNELMDPDALSPIMAQPAYTNMVVKVTRL